MSSMQNSDKHFSTHQSGTSSLANQSLSLHLTTRQYTEFDPEMWKLAISVILLVVTVSVDALYKYETKWFEVPLDHFGYETNKTFQIKYLVNDEYWDKDYGPIFFYTGNEGQIELFAQHTGFMWETAPEFRAKIVFAEHRYYGASMPFGNKSLERENVVYLSSQQALADYADLVNYLLGDTIKPRYPVITFGGSYGGMLSAYFRMKYPHLVTGAIAASAPIHMYPDMVPCEVFNRIVTSSFNLANSKCVENIKKSWAIVRNITTNVNNTLQKDWKLCDPVKNSTQVNRLIDFLASMYTTLAMVNYPYPCDYLVPLPGQPVRVVCQYLNQTMSNDKIIEGIGKMLQVFANYDGKTKCIDYMLGEDYGNLDASGWDFQACTEMVMPMCSTGQNDMFEPSPWNFTEYAQDCHAKFGVMPRKEAARVMYGGNQLQAASNIVFSNGLLDPWIGGGILNSISDSVVAVLVIDGAHHLDLMPANDKDPETVRSAREVHKTHMRKWVKNFRDQK